MPNPDAATSAAATRYDSPIGPMTIAERDGHLIGAWFEGQKYELANIGDWDWGTTPLLTAATAWLDSYFAGTRPAVTLPLAPHGTDFQKRVWNRVAEIPYGETTTYGTIASDLAASTGSRTSARAVGSAVGRNPLLLFVPCHRVVGSNGKMTGYAGGLERKGQLFAFERGSFNRDRNDPPEDPDPARPSPTRQSPNDDALYAAYLAKDPRFDGIFYTGITSTGIYCRATCPSRTPKRENCRFFPSAAAAEAAGFRPCLRCRPEIAPGMPANLGAAGSTLAGSTPAGPAPSPSAPTRSTPAADLAHRAADAIREGEHSRPISEIARDLGVSERHLRRLFEAEYGATPANYRTTSRLLLAKSLLTDTDLPMTRIAFASGFESIRRFNDEFSLRYQLTPTELRESARNSGTPASFENVDSIELHIGYRPPFDYARLLGFLGRRAVGGVESVGAGAYRRSLRIASGTTRVGWVSVTNDPEHSRLRCQISDSLVDVLPVVLSKISRIFDTGASPSAIEAGLESFRADVGGTGNGVGELGNAPGLRLAGSADPFEMAVRAVLGQQVTVAAARTMMGRVAQEFGQDISTPFDDVVRVFPDAGAFAGSEAAERLGRLGVTRQKQGAILGLARAIESGALILRPGADPDATRRALLEIPGVGPWTAEYLLMRACSYPDAFPSTDFAVRSAFRGLTVREIEERAQAWRPWRSYAVMALWQSGEPIAR